MLDKPKQQPPWIAVALSMVEMKIAAFHIPRARDGPEQDNLGRDRIERLRCRRSSQYSDPVDTVRGLRTHADRAGAEHAAQDAVARPAVGHQFVSGRWLGRSSL